MTHSQAVAFLAKYYNETVTADNVRVKVLKDWMTKNVCEADLESFLERIMVACKFFPKVADIAEAVKPIVEIKAERAWSELLTVSNRYDVLISDHVSFQVVKGYGSWSRFCESRDNYRELTHKDFVRRYVLFADAGNMVSEITPLAGWYHENYGSAFQTSVDLVTIGEPSKLQRIGVVKNKGVEELAAGISRGSKHDPRNRTQESR